MTQWFSATARTLSLNPELLPTADRYCRTMDAEIVYITLDDEDRAELDRLTEGLSGDRSAFLQEAIKVMADRERAEDRHIDAREWGS